LNVFRGCSSNGRALP